MHDAYSIHQAWIIVHESLSSYALKYANKITEQKLNSVIFKPVYGHVVWPFFFMMYHEQPLETTAISLY